MCCLYGFFGHFCAGGNLGFTMVSDWVVGFFAEKCVAGACHKCWRGVLIDGHFLCDLLSRA